MKPCDAWREAIFDHALGDPPAPGLAEHLEACPACAAALEEVRAGAARMDSGLRRLVASDPSPSLAARVLANLAPPVPRWKIALALCSLVVAAGIAVWTSRDAREAAPRESVSISSWRSPTEGLLRSSADPLFKTVPKFGGVNP